MINKSKGCLRADLSALLSPFSRDSSSMSLRSSFTKSTMCIRNIMEHTWAYQHMYNHGYLWIYNICLVCISVFIQITHSKTLLVLFTLGPCACSCFASSTVTSIRTCSFKCQVVELTVFAMLRNTRSESNDLKKSESSYQHQQQK